MDEEQKTAIIELLAKGVSISEIARKLGVSRGSVFRVIDSEMSPEVKALEKEVKMIELRKKLKRLREPVESVSELDNIKHAVDNLSSMVLGLLEISPEVKIERRMCIYCGETLEHVKKRVPSGRFVHSYQCHRCNKVFTFPYEF